MGHRKQITLENVVLYNMRGWVEDNGILTPIEGEELPFSIERVFYIYNVPSGDIRGCHAHFRTEQLLLCLHGTVKVICKDGKNEKCYLLDSPQKGLYIPPLIWDEQIYGDEAVLVSLCSTPYTPSDYISDYNEYTSLVNR
jgi:UDP-2-acetamido-3-amino-2,3-dideoxy-glucuronate N-acetyltransferase